MTPTRWGILGPGRIARSFAHDIAVTPGAELVAVGSRSDARARAFADELGAAAAYGSYEELVADDSVDVVYIATPHALHLEHARLAFEAGKHVLCEKPLALSAAEAEEMIALAQEHDRFLMEAMWMACHPVVLAVRDRLLSGELGVPRHLHAELGFRVDSPPEDRMFAPELGAGALLDMGVYPLHLAYLMLGEAEELTGYAALTDHAVDADVAIVGRYPGGALATMTASITSWSSRRAEIATTTGRIEMEDFHHPVFASYAADLPGEGSDLVSDTGPHRIESEVPVIGRGFGHEILEVGRCLAGELRESPLVPHAQTLTILRQMDTLREQIGVRYAADTASVTTAPIG